MSRNKVKNKKSSQPKVSGECLIYDSSCAFCTGLAGYFHRRWGVRIVPNNMTGNTKLEKKLIQKDVHYIIYNKTDNSYVMYDGAEAAVRMIGKKYPVLIWLYYVPVIRQLIQFLYWIVKKLRKYLR
jgi:predicted DCC family thiol-disulfide oxidoreductase YuxK